MINTHVFGTHRLSWRRSEIFTTTGQILFYNRWKPDVENCRCIVPDFIKKLTRKKNIRYQTSTYVRRRRRIWYLCDLLQFKIYMVQATRLYSLLWRTCVKSSVVWGPGPVVRRCSPQSLTEPVSRRPPTHTSDSAPIDVHPTPTIYLCVYTPIYIRRVTFAHVVSFVYQKWPFYIPEHYRCSLMRVLRDVDLDRPATRGRRRVELPNPVVHIPSVTHQCSAPTTHRTSTCMQSHQWNHHYRDYLYNISHNTKHKYINLVRLRTRHGVNIPWIPLTVTPSLPDTTYSKKEPMFPPKIRHYRLPHSPKDPAKYAGEDPHHQKSLKCTVEHAHKSLFPPCDEVEHDTPIAHRLIGSYRYDTCMHLCPYVQSRRFRGVVRGQPLTDPSPVTMPRICSPFPVLVTSWPPPFKFAQESCFLFFSEGDTTTHTYLPLFCWMNEF